jgi:amino acid permease
VATFVRIVAGFLLIAHGLVHLLYLAPDVEEFTLEDSWVMPNSASHSVGDVLMVVTAACFVLLGLAVWGVPMLTNAWPAIAIAAAVSSLALLIAFWDVHLAFGLILDLAIIVVAVMRPAWTQQIG